MTDAVDAPATTPVSGAEPATSQAPTTAQPNTPPAAAPQQAPEGDKPAAPAIPEKYEFKGLPEGYTLDEAQIGEWSGVFKELGLSQEQAQKLVEMDAKRFTAANSPEAQQAAALAQRNQQVSQWEASLKQDPDLGGAKFDATVETAQKAMASFGSPQLKEMLAESGLGSHPEVVRFFAKVGKELSEGQLHRTTTEQPSEQSWAKRMYPDMN